MFATGWCSGYIVAMQLELFPFEPVTPGELELIYRSIRHSYWHLRNLRAARWGEAKARKHYRLVAAQKKTPTHGSRIKA